MIIENVSFAEIKFVNDIVFIPHIINGDNDNGVINNFVNYFGLLIMEPDYRFLDGGPMKILCTRDTYRYIIPFKIDEFCKNNNYKYKFKAHKNDKYLSKLFL